MAVVGPGRALRDPHITAAEPGRQHRRQVYASGAMRRVVRNSPAERLGENLHKRSGDFSLGGKHFKFHMVPAYPKTLSKEYLLVDLLNNLKHLSENTDLVLRNLKSRLHQFDRDSVQKLLERYGRPAARNALHKAYA